MANKGKVTNMIARGLTIGALTLTASLGVASAQMPEGRLFVFRSTAQGACPPLDWHLVVGPNNTLSGMISWDNMKSMAHATGTVNLTARTFTMQAQEEGGQRRSATIDGTVGQNGWLRANVKGQNVTCTGVNVPWYTAPPAGSSG
jgi:hypothetical protein